MSAFMVDNPTQSLIFMRVINSFIAAFLLFAQISFCRNQRRMAWLCGYTLTIIPMGVLLTASINPSGWALTGVSHSWMFLLNLLDRDVHSNRNRIFLLTLWLFSNIIVVVSRNDAVFWLILSNIFVVAFVSLRNSWSARTLLICIFTFFSVSFLVFRTNPIWGWLFASLPRNFRLTITDLQWFSHWLIQFFAVLIQPLGFRPIGQNISGQQLVQIPPPVWIFGIGILFSVLLFAIIESSKRQIVFLFISACLMMISMLYFNNLLGRDLFQFNGRYVLPFMPFCITGTVLLSRNSLQLMSISKLRLIVIWLLTISNFLSLYSTIETFTSQQSFSIKAITAGLDQWWWIGLPLGPNIVVFLGAISFYWFLVNVWSTLPTFQLPVNSDSWDTYD
jgi:hypothetical protein